MSDILSGYRVLDFGRYISGPFCAALLGDLGAEVIRIEPPGGSDDRFVMPMSRVGEEGALYQQVNRGKRSLELDLAAPGARTVISRIVADTDVVIANMPPKALGRLGLDYESLAALKPDIVLTTINAYGADSPYSDAIGFDGTGQALSGAQWLTGMPDQPYRSAVSYVDYATAMSAAVGTVAALLRRERTGRGDHVQSSLLGTALTMTNPMLIEEAAGRSRVATGNRSPIAGPSDLVRTSDGWVMIQVIGQPMFSRWAAMIGQPALVDDPRFGDDMARGENGTVLSAITAAWAAKRTTAECLDLLRRHRLPGSPLLKPSEVLTAPEVAQAGLVHTVPLPTGGEVPMVGSPFQFSGDGCTRPRPAPLLGADTLALLREACFDDAEIADLRQSGTIGAIDMKEEPQQ